MGVDDGMFRQGCDGVPVHEVVGVGLWSGDADEKRLLAEKHSSLILTATLRFASRNLKPIPLPPFLSGQRSPEGIGGFLAAGLVRNERDSRMCFPWALYFVAEGTLMPLAPLVCEPGTAAPLLVTSGLNTCDPVSPLALAEPCRSSLPRSAYRGTDACSKIQSEAARACSGGQR